MMPALEVRFVNGERGHYPLDCLEVLKCQKVRMSKYGLVSTNMHDDILKVRVFLFTCYFNVNRFYSSMLLRHRYDLVKLHRAFRT